MLLLLRMMMMMMIMMIIVMMIVIMINHDESYLTSIDAEPVKHICQLAGLLLKLIRLQISTMRMELHGDQKLIIMITCLHSQGKHSE